MHDHLNNIEVLEELFWQISQKLNKHTRRYLAKEGLTMARFIALSSLTADEPITMGDLQRRLLMAPATLTGLVDGLVEANLVIRWRKECDRRAVFLEPTAQGIEMVDKVFAHRALLLKTALTDYQNLNLDRLNNDLNGILRCLEVIPIEERNS